MDREEARMLAEEFEAVQRLRAEANRQGLLRGAAGVLVLWLVILPTVLFLLCLLAWVLWDVFRTFG